MSLPDYFCTGPQLGVFLNCNSRQIWRARGACGRAFIFQLSHTIRERKNGEALNIASANYPGTSIFSHKSLSSSKATSLAALSTVPFESSPQPAFNELSRIE
jgi:hypothetical protein